MSLIRLHFTHQIVVCSELFAAHEAFQDCLWGLPKALSASFLRNRKLRWASGKWHWKCWQEEGRRSGTRKFLLLLHMAEEQGGPPWGGTSRSSKLALVGTPRPGLFSATVTVPLLPRLLEWLWNVMESQQHVPDLGHRWSWRRYQRLGWNWTLYTGFLPWQPKILQGLFFYLP